MMKISLRPDTVYHYLFRYLSSKGPIRLRFWLILQSLIHVFIPKLDVLVHPVNISISSGTDLEIPELSGLLQGDVLGTWSLDEHTIYLLWKMLFERHPEVVIECGAGISTLVLAQYANMSISEGSTMPRIISIEQNYDVKTAIEKRLAMVGLQKFVQIIHGPISETGNYQLRDVDMLRCLVGRRADWLLIDGPSGPDGCRVSTLPLLQRYCKPNAQWFLDDALRDGELAALKAWSDLQGVSIAGIYAVGKGVATGFLLGY